MIRVLVVDDSAVAREYLTQILNRDPAIRVVGTAVDGTEAVVAVEKLRPDLITMDIHMPRMDGPAAIRRIMQTQPTPIVVVTGNEITAEVRATYESLDSGALAIVPRPGSVARWTDGEDPAETLLRTVKLMAEVKVVRRWSRNVRDERPAFPAAAPRALLVPPQVVILGASTGGPTALKEVLSPLAADFPLPLVVVQHIASGFVEGFTAWLRDVTRREVEVAHAGAALRPGRLYVAPDGRQLGFSASGSIQLLERQPDDTLCPSVNYTFLQAARVFGAGAVGVLLTGMGRDGADGLLALRQAGALTIAQDRESRMPGEAVRLQAARLVLSPAQIAATLNTLPFPARS
jgi:two-component system, chemotaxis family, protein-glutamate methylesterase/glutaminase